MIATLQVVIVDGSAPAGSIEPLRPHAQRIDIPRGEDTVIRLVVRKPDYTRVDLAGFPTIRLAVRRQLADASAMFTREAVLRPGTFPDDADEWTASIALASADTLGLIEKKKYHFDVQLTDTSGNRWQGVPDSIFHILPIVSQPGEPVLPPLVDLGAPIAIGPAGLSVLHGDRPPLPSDGRDGEFWIDDSSPTRDLYGPKTDGVWGAGFSMQGPPGTAGTGLSTDDPLPGALVPDPGASGQASDAAHVHPYTIAVASGTDGWMSGTMAQQLADLVAADFGTQIADIDLALDTLTTSVADHTASIASLTADLSALTTVVSGHTSTLASHDSALASLISDVSAVAGDLSALATVVGGHTTTLASHTSSIAALTSGLSALTTTVAGHTTAFATASFIVRGATNAPANSQVLNDIGTGYVRNTLTTEGDDDEFHVGRLSTVATIPYTDVTGGPPVSAKYIVQEASAGLSAEQSLGALTTGILKNTVTGTTGVLSIATASDIPSLLTTKGDLLGFDTAPVRVPVAVIDGWVVTSDAASAAGWKWAAAAATGADALGSYIVQTTANKPANAQVLGDLTTGIIKNTTGTGVLSIAGAADMPAPGGQLGGTYASATVLGILETGGPTTLTFGAIADGEFFKRVGSTVVGAAGGGGGYATIERPNGTPVTARSIMSFTTEFTVADNVDTTDISLATGGVALAKVVDLAANSVLGRSTNSSGVMAAIAAGTDGHVLRLAGTTLGFGTLAAGAFADTTIAGSKLSGFTDTTMPVANSSGQLVSSAITLASNTLTYAAAVSGGTLALTLSNTSNTASSAATLTIKTGGATAADPSLVLSTTVTDWKLTVDNATNDRFRLFKGATELIRLDPTATFNQTQILGNGSVGSSVSAWSASGNSRAGVAILAIGLSANNYLNIGPDTGGVAGHGVAGIFFDGTAYQNALSWATVSGSGGGVLKLMENAGRVTALGTATVASASSATWDGFDHQASTLTFSGSTAVTTATGVNYVDIKQPTITAASAVAISFAAALRIAGAPVAAGSATITKSYSLWIDGGLPRIDSSAANGAVATSLGSVGPTGANTTVQEWLALDVNGTTRYAPLF
jgi:hypothetical protein